MDYNKYINNLENIYHESPQNNGSILNDIIQHPFIDTLPTDVNLFTDLNCLNNSVKYNVILYRIQHHNDNHYVEFYLPYHSNEYLFNIEYYSAENIDKSISNSNLLEYLKKHIQHIPGVKRFKGHIIHNNMVYSIVQVRDKNIVDISNNMKSNHSYYNYNNWLTLWDIIAYKHVFREKIDNSIVDFFVKNYKIACLFLDKKRCLIPMILYCSVADKHNTFIKQNKSVQYCQRENDPIVYLNCDYLLELNNVRNVCFIEDTDIYTNMNMLRNKSYIILKSQNNLDYLFKNDDNIISYIK